MIELTSRNRWWLTRYTNYLSRRRETIRIKPQLSCIGLFLEYLNKDIVKISDTDLIKHTLKYEEYLENRKIKTDGWHGERLKESTIRNYLQYIKSFLRWMKRPVPSELHGPKVPRMAGDFLEKRELNQVLKKVSHLPDISQRTAIRLLIMTGIRLDELITLKLRSVKVNTRFITVFGKGKKERTIPVPDALRHPLKAYLRYRKTPDIQRRVVKFDKNILLVRTCKHDNRLRRLYPVYVERLVGKLHTGLYPHMLRRTYATWLLYYGQPLPDVSKNLGHSHTSTTANSYTMATKKGAAMTNRIFKRLLVKK